MKKINYLAHLEVCFHGNNKGEIDAGEDFLLTEGVFDLFVLHDLKEMRIVDPLSASQSLFPNRFC